MEQNSSWETRHSLTWPRNPSPFTEREGSLPHYKNPPLEPIPCHLSAVYIPRLWNQLHTVESKLY